ncbi:MAG: transposase [Boseongicola sp. SB0675_bin_26]|nr:transposase [Boseongicola sp. SB0675_bin_26]
MTIGLRFWRIDASSGPNHRRNSGTGKTCRCQGECWQGGADRCGVGAGQAHAARQGDRSRRHRAGQPAVPWGGGWRIRTVSPWRGLPKRVSIWNNVLERFRRRADSGAFERVFSALCRIQTLRFCCLFSQNAEPKPCRSFICTSEPTITAVEVPLMSGSVAGRRSQDLAVQFLTHDATRADELVAALQAAMPDRPNHRVGNRNQDLEDLGHHVDNPTAV